MQSWCLFGMLRIVDSNVDTLTESCEGAVNFMVIEMRDRSLHQFHLWRCRDCSWISSLAAYTVCTIGGWYSRSLLFQKLRSPDLGWWTTF